jgi:hypothetical protein
MAISPNGSGRTKRCACCGEPFPISSFGRNRQAKDGLHYYTKAHAAKKQKQWAKANPATVKRMRTDYLDRMRKMNAERNPYE